MQVRYGVGRHVYYLEENQILKCLKWASIGDVFGALMVAIPKFGVVIFLDKCLSQVRRPSLRALYALAAFLVVITIIDIFLLFFQCRPVYAPWTAGVEATCWDPRIAVDFSYVVGGKPIPVTA